MRLTPEKYTRTDNSILAGGITLLLTALLLYLYASVTLLLHHPITPWIFPLAAASACALTPLFFIRHHPGENLRHLAPGIMCALAIEALSIWLAGSFSDFSFDGNAYHQEIMAMLMQGWVPLEGYHGKYEALIFSLHYTQGFEMSEACIAMTFGSIETGKALNFIFFGAMAAITYGVVIRLVPKSRLNAVLITALTALNPVVLGQIATFYIDYALYDFLVLSLLSVAMAFSAPYAPQRRAWWGLYFLIILMSVGSKFNFAFYQALFGIILLIWCLATKQKERAWTVLDVSGIAAITALLLCIHPYITNWIDYGHPLYPLMGKNPVDIMTYNTPEEFLGRNRFINFIASLAGFEHPTYDARIGGFGPLIIPMLLLCLWPLIKYRTRIPGYIKLIILLILAGCFIFDTGWWARYVPYFWGIIPLTAFAAAKCGTEGKTKREALAFNWTETAMAALTAAAFIGMTALHIWRNEIIRDCIKESATVYVTNPNIVMEMQFKERKIPMLLPPESSDSVKMAERYPMQVRLGWYTGLDTDLGNEVITDSMTIEKIRHKVYFMGGRIKDGRIELSPKRMIHALIIDKDK